MKEKLIGFASRFFATEFGQTIKHGLTYLSGNLALKSLRFVGIPILTRLLTEEDYGILNIFMSYVAIGGSVFTLNTYVGIGRYYHEKKGDFSDFFGTAIIISLGLTFLFYAALFSYKEEAAALLRLPSYVVLFIVPVALITILRSFHLQVFRAERASKKVRSLNVIVGVLSFILGISLVYLHPEENRYMGQLWSQLLVLAVIIVIVFYRLRNRVSFNIKRDHIKFMFSYGVPLLPAYISGFILAQFDRVMLGSYVDNAEAGLYSFAYNIGMILITIVRPIENSFSPKFFQYMNAKKYKEHDVQVLKIVSLTSFLACGVVLFADILGIVLGAETFHKSLYLIPIIALGQYILLLNPIYKRQISFTKKTIYTSITTIMAGLLNIGLNMIYIPKHGSIAAAFTTLVSYIFLLCLTYLITKYIIKSHSTSLGLILPKVGVVMLASAFYYVCFYWLDLNVFIEIILKALVLLVCTGLLYWQLSLKFFKNLLKP